MTCFPKVTVLEPQVKGLFAKKQPPLPWLSLDIKENTKCKQYLKKQTEKLLPM